MNFTAAHKGAKVLQRNKLLSTSAHGTEAANISCSKVTAKFNVKTKWHTMWYEPKVL